MLRAAMSVAILMPVFGDARTLAATLASIRARADAFDGVVAFVVDDGSEPAITPADLPAPTASFSIVLARHLANLGQGAAIETARRVALAEGPFGAYVTMDADGQHRVEDVIELARAIFGGADVALGNRFLGGSEVPRGRRALLGAARAFERVVTGLAHGDAHNGLRAFSRRAIERTPIRQNRMAHATEIKQRLSRAGPLVVVEVPVTVRYSAESLARGQRASGAVDIVRDLLLQYLFGEP
jgi:glycosyltransferase involved in cell wall biosynthesis